MEKVCRLPFRPATRPDSERTGAVANLMLMLGVTRPRVAEMLRGQIPTTAIQRFFDESPRIRSAGTRQQWRGILRRLERRYPDKRINEYTSHDLRDCRCAEPPGRRSTSSGADAPVADRRGDRSAVRCVPSRSGRGARRARCLGARFLSAVWFAHPRNRQHSLGGHQFARKHTFGARQGSQAGHYLPTGGLGEMLTHWRTRAADGLGRLPVADDPLLITFRSKGGDARRSTPGRGMG